MTSKRALNSNEALPESTATSSLLMLSGARRANEAPDGLDIADHSTDPRKSPWKVNLRSDIERFVRSRPCRNHFSCLRHSLVVPRENFVSLSFHKFTAIYVNCRSPKLDLLVFSTTLDSQSPGANGDRFLNLQLSRDPLGLDDFSHFSKKVSHEVELCNSAFCRFHSYPKNRIDLGELILMFPADIARRFCTLEPPAFFYDVICF